VGEAWVAVKALSEDLGSKKRNRAEDVSQDTEELGQEFDFFTAFAFGWVWMMGGYLSCRCVAGRWATGTREGHGVCVEKYVVPVPLSTSPRASCFLGMEGWEWAPMCFVACIKLGAKVQQRGVHCWTGTVGGMVTYPCCGHRLGARQNVNCCLLASKGDTGEDRSISMPAGRREIWK